MFVQQEPAKPLMTKDGFDPIMYCETKAVPKRKVYLSFN